MKRRIANRNKSFRPIENLENRVLMHAGHEHLPAVLESSDTAIARINVGGRNFTDTTGLGWSTDFGFTGGKAVKSKFAVADTDNDLLFANRRQGNFTYTIPATDGPYTLSLGFIDTLKKAGKRIFNIDAEGQRIENNLDIAAVAGPRAALAISYTVNVTGGALNLAFTGVKGKGKPVVSAISLAPIVIESPAPPDPGPIDPGPADPVAVPPAAPVALQAAGQSTSTVLVTWTDGSNDETSFELQRSFNGGAFSSVVSLSANAGSYIDFGLQAGTTYQYRVRAIGAAGASEWTTVATATTAANPEPPPPAPTAPAAPANLNADLFQNTQVQLTWSDQSDNETGFLIERSLNGAAFTSLTTIAANTTSYSDSAVTDGVTYSYRVVAANAVGNSAASNVDSVAIPAVGPTPIDTFTNVTWAASLAMAPVGKAEALRAVVDGKLYVFAGFTSSGPVASSHVYDPATNVWTAIADMPRRLTHAGVSVEGRDVYFAGGYFGTGSGFTQQFGSVEVWKYNVDSNTYVRINDLPVARAGGGLVTIGRELHYFSGNNSARQDVSDHYVLDLDNLSAGWKTKASLPIGRSHMGYVNFGGKIYAIAGQTGNDEGLTTQSAVHVYDPATDTWTQKASLPTPISHISSATFVMGDRIIVAGGETAHEAATNKVFAYDPAANTWTALTSLPANRFSGVAAAIGDKIYFAGGSSQRTLYLGTPVLT